MIDDKLSSNFESGSDEPAAEANPLIKKFQKRINISTKKWKSDFQAIKAARDYVKGRSTKMSDIIGPDGNQMASSQTHNANIVYATLQGLMPHLYAKNPEVTVRPTTQVEPETTDYERAGMFADTLEIIVNRSINDADLKRTAKQAIRDVQTSRVAIVKVTYQTDFFRDPLVYQRIEDLQKKLAEVRGKSQKMEDPDLTKEDLEAEEQLMEQQVKALESQVEVVRAEQLVVDPIPIDDFRIDPNIDNLLRYREANWMAHASWLDPDDVQDTFGITSEELKKLNKYQRNASGIPERMGHELASDITTSSNDENTDVAEVILVWELWDRKSSSMYTWAEGGEQWLRPPHMPETMGQRWYPFFLLGFNWMDSSVEFPTSDVELLENLGREYDSIRRQGFEHRKLSKPHFIADKSRIGSREDIESFSISTLGEVTLVNSAGADPNSLFRPADSPPYNPQIYDTTNIRSDIEWQSGFGDAQRGAVMRAKTATEANIQNQGLGSRVDEKRDSVEDWITDIAKFSAEVLIQNMSLERAQRIAGPKAFWPQVSKEELFTMVEVDIRAGSTGKPDQQQDLAQWMEVLPLLMQLSQQALQMRGAGVPDKENPSIQLIMETFKRLDERISIEKFLGGVPQDGQDVDPGRGQVGPDGATPQEAQTAEQEAQNRANGGQGGQQGADPGMQEQQAMQEQQMAQQQQAQEQEAMARKGQQEEQKAQLDMAKGQMDLQQQELELKSKQLELEIRQMEAMLTKASIEQKGDIEAELAALQMQKLQSDIDLKDAQIEKTKKDMNRPQGQATH